MRHRSILLSIVVVFGFVADVKATLFQFETNSTATQTINIPAFGASLDLTSPGTQVFTLDTTSGFANVTSDFKGTDLMFGGTSYNYNLYNTTTVGTITTDGVGGYNISFSLLFEVKVTSGDLAGLTLDTQTPAIFAADVPALPFPSGTAFSDGLLNAAIPLFVTAVPAGLEGLLGAEIGSSVNRIVTVNSVIPEPSTIVTAGLGLILGTGAFYRRRSRLAV